MGVRNLDRALRPRNVALAAVGPARLARAVLRNLLDHGYAGEVLLVGGKRSGAGHVPRVGRVKDLPPRTDLLVLDAPAGQLEELAREAAEVALPGVLILSEEASTSALRDLHREFPGTRLIGPGSRGMIVPRLKLNASLTPGMPAHGGLAVISSSPWLWEEMVFRALRAGFGLSHLISLGDQVDVDLADATDYLDTRGRVRALAMEADLLPPPDRLLSALWCFARDRPLVACRCDPDWDWAVFSCVIRRAGGIPLRQSAELLGVLELLSRLDHPPPGHRVAVLTSERDRAAIQTHLKPTTELCPATRESLERSGCSVKDEWALLPPGSGQERWLSALNSLLGDPRVHMLLSSVPSGLEDRVAGSAARAAAMTGKPLVALADEPSAGQVLRDKGMAVYDNSAEAAHALGCLADYVRNLDTLHLSWGKLPTGPAHGEIPELPPGDISGETLAQVLARWDIRVCSAVEDLADHSFRGGLRHHPVFGTVVVISCSGDRQAQPAVGVPPLTEPVARSMLSALPRELPSSSASALVDLLLRISRVAMDLPTLVELDLQPVIVRDRNATALGGRGRVAAAPLRPHLCLASYPEGSVLGVRLKDGTNAWLRPIRPDDEPLWCRMLSRSSPDSLRLRYHSVRHEPSRRMARRHCCIDYRRELVIVAEVEEEGAPALAGEGELFMDPDCDLAEFAVFVPDAWQGKGLGSILTDHMIDTARRFGARRVACELTPDNVRMITLLQRRGFEVRIVVEDGVVFAEKKLR